MNDSSQLSGRSACKPEEDISRLLKKRTDLLRSIINEIGDEICKRKELRNGALREIEEELLKLSSHPFWGAVLDALTTTRATWNGHSASTWKDLVIKTNGFDERMLYGGQDREFGERLMNMGIKGKQVRYRCSCVHLDHARGYASPEGKKKNREIRDDTHNNRITRTNYGITEMLERENAQSV